MTLKISCRDAAEATRDQSAASAMQPRRLVRGWLGDRGAARAIGALSRDQRRRPARDGPVPRLGMRPAPPRRIVNMVAPYTKPLFERLARGARTAELLVVSETPMERDRRWDPEVDLPFEHVLLDSWTFDLARFAVGSGFAPGSTPTFMSPSTRSSARRLSRPDVVVAGRAAASGRRRRTSRRSAAAGATAGRSFPGGGASPVRVRAGPDGSPVPGSHHFMRASDACIAYGPRH